MLGLGRSSLSRLQRPFSTAGLVSSESVSATPPLTLRVDSRLRQRRFNKNNTATITSEQVELQQKYQQELSGDLRSAESLFDIAERAEWRTDAIPPLLLEVAAKLLAERPSECSKLTDRQLAVILSCFGSRAESTSRARRSALLSLALNSLSKNAIVLNTHSRNAVMAAKIDNGETFSVLEELRAFEEHKIAENLASFEQLARGYSVQGSVQGVVDIINYCKSNGHEVSEHMIESMVYCLAKTKSYEKAETFSQKFGSAVVRLNCAIARAAAENGDSEAVTKALSAIPSATNIHSIENNLQVLEVFLTFVEAGKLDAVDVLRSFLKMTPDGSTLVDYHRNGYVINRARRARHEGSLETALAIYSVVNPVYRSSSLEIQLKETFMRQLNGSERLSIEQAVAIARKMESCGILSDHMMFILETTRRADVLEGLLKRMIEENTLGNYLKQKPELKMSIPKVLGLEMSNTLPENRRAALLSMIASVFFTVPERDYSALRRFNSILFSLASKDVTIVIPALEKTVDERVKYEFGTAIMDQIIASNDDPLKYEKLRKLLASKAVTGLNAYVLQPRLRHMLTIKRHDISEDDADLKLVSELIALTFPGESSKMPSYFRGKSVLVNLLGLELFTLERARRLVEFLELANNRVGFSYDDMNAAKYTLTEMKQPGKAELLERLRKRSQAIARWQESSLEALIDEYQHLKTTKDVKQGMLNMLQEIIMSKVISMKDVQVSSLVSIFANYLDKRETAGFRLKSLSSQAFEIVFRNLLLQKNMKQATQLWSVKPSFTVDSALSYIAVAVLENDTELADKLSEELRGSAKTISLGSLETVGKTIGDVSNQEIQRISEYFTMKFGLQPTQTRRIVKQIKIKQLKRLLESGKLEEAFNLAREESEAVGSAFGQYELLDAAFTRGTANSVIVDVFNLVQKHHGKNIAVLDLAFSSLMHGRKSNAAQLFATENLHISGPKLDFFVGKCVDAARPDVLLELFLNLSRNDEKAKNVDLNRLLLQLGKLYYKANDYEALHKLDNTLQNISFPMEQQVRSILDISKNRTAATLKSDKAK